MRDGKCALRNEGFSVSVNMEHAVGAGGGGVIDDVSMTGPAGPSPYESDWSQSDAGWTDNTSVLSLWTDDDDDGHSVSSVLTRHSEEYPHGRCSLSVHENRGPMPSSGASGDRRRHDRQARRQRSAAFQESPRLGHNVHGGSDDAAAVARGAVEAGASRLDSADVLLVEPAPSLARPPENRVEAWALSSATRHAGMGYCPQNVCPQTGSMLPFIEENEHGPCLGTEALYSMVAHSNAMDYEGGPINDLTKRSRLGLAYANVPNSALMWTTKPLTAIITRWQFNIFILLIAVLLLYGQSSDWTSLFKSNPYTMRRIEVDTIKIFENPVPDFKLEQGRRGEAVASNRRLKLIDAGIFVDGYDLKLTEFCNTTVTSDSSFEIVCTEDVSVHGFWVRANGALRDGHASRRGDAAAPAYYDLAGIQLSYTVWCDDSANGQRHPASKIEIYNVMGTGQQIKGTTWEVVESRASSEGLFRIPLAQLPLDQRPLRDISLAAAYLIVSKIE